MCGDAHTIDIKPIHKTTEVTMGCIKSDPNIEIVFSEGKLFKNGRFEITAHEWNDEYWVNREGFNKRCEEHYKEFGRKQYKP